MKHKLNPIGFLSLLALISLLGVTTGKKGWYGSLGYLYFIRYFWVIADEGFWNNIKQASTAAYMVQLFALLPTLLFSSLFVKGQNFIPVAFGISFATGNFIFLIFLTYLEWKENLETCND